MTAAETVFIFIVLSFCSRCLDSQTPDLAYNGNTAGNWVNYVQCTCTSANDAVPWWMLDLLHSYSIAGVNVWNRLDASDEIRFTQISLGVSPDQSVWSTFNTDLFNRCAYWTGVPTDAMNPVSLACSAPVTGRYLALYKNRTGLIDATQAYFNFCEVDVLAVATENQLVAMEMQPSFSSTSTSLLAALAKIRSDIECISQCSPLPSCLFALFKASTFECWLFASHIIPSSFTDVLSSTAAKFAALYVH